LDQVSTIARSENARDTVHFSFLRGNEGSAQPA
jgi:hypothetical protein